MIQSIARRSRLSSLIIPKFDLYSHSYNFQPLNPNNLPSNLPQSTHFSSQYSTFAPRSAISHSILSAYPINLPQLTKSSSGYEQSLNFCNGVRLFGSKNSIFWSNFIGHPLNLLQNTKSSHGYDKKLVISSGFRLFSSQTAVIDEVTTSDGLTVEKILGNNWSILDESENDWRSHASAIAQSIHLIKKRLKWKQMLVRFDLLTAEVNKPNHWDDPVLAGKISREQGSLLSKVKEVISFEHELCEHIDMLKLAREDNDSELELDSVNALLKIRRDLKEKELEAMLAGEHDSCSCFIEVQAGAGGTESNDWASIVMQMYKSWAHRRGFCVSVVDQMPGDIAGIKRATIKVDGEYAFGYAKAEVGVHRLVRISPFDSAKRRHTSFAAVAVIPILTDVSSRVQIKESDLRIDRYRSGGAGGQSVNTTDSAVRITHIPTGIVATCQNERSQHQNKASAMSVLQSRIDQLEMARQAQMNAHHTESLTDIGWGAQIRTYVLHPHRMVKDLRTNYEVSDPDSVLAGDIDEFIISYLSFSLDKDEGGAG